MLNPFNGASLTKDRDPIVSYLILVLWLLNIIVALLLGLLLCFGQEAYISSLGELFCFGWLLAGAGSKNGKPILFGVQLIFAVLVLLAISGDFSFVHHSLIAGIDASDFLIQKYTRAVLSIEPHLLSSLSDESFQILYDDNLWARVGVLQAFLVTQAFLSVVELLLSLSNSFLEEYPRQSGSSPLPFDRFRSGFINSRRSILSSPANGPVQDLSKPRNYNSLSSLPRPSRPFVQEMVPSKLSDPTLSRNSAPDTYISQPGPDSLPGASDLERSFLNGHNFRAARSLQPSKNMRFVDEINSLDEIPLARSDIKSDA